MAHPAGSELRSRGSATTPSRTANFSDQAHLLNEDAVLAKHRMMEEQAIEIGLLNDEESLKSTVKLYFQDGKRPIDFVLAFETPESEEGLKEEEMEKQKDFAEKRKVYEGNLTAAGLELEYEDEVSTKDDKTKTQFVKIHAPWDILIQTAEDMTMKMPIKENDIETKTWYEEHIGQSIRQMIKNNNPFEIHGSCVPTTSQHFMAYFKKDKVGEFIGSHDHDNFFSRAERSRMVEHLCGQQRYGEDRFEMGIKKLIFDGGYSSAYSLHSGGEETPDDQSPTNDRQRLRQDWARFGRLLKYQPYDAIKDYFGTEIGLYFAWLGFYTVMLVPAALFGLIVFIYGISNAANFAPVRDLCDKANEKEFYMCPLCDRQCPYWSLTSNCYYAMVVHAFDNDGTVVFAIFMSIWATLFLEFWKRRQAVLAYRWHMMHYEDTEEVPRPEFVATAPTWRKDPITGKQVPHIPKMTRYQRFAGIGSAIAFMIFLVLAAVVGVVAYRAAVYFSLTASGDRNARKNAKLITMITAALLNLVCINLLKFFYEKLAVWLTNWENPRTITDYKDSFTYKMYLFQFVNNYSSIFYIAFFKLNFLIGSPGNYRRFANKWRLDGCGAGGCLVDLCVQLIIIMVGQQIISNVTEVAIPGLMKWWKLRQAKKEHVVDLPQWEADYKLSPLPEHHLFWEYLEVVLQFGFVTMFVAAFPLAPLFALVNCVFELRVDAINFVCQFRRPAPQRAQDIGAWFRIMEGLANISVLINAFVIAFTSDFIPRLVYKYSVSADGSLTGYVNNSLSYFNIADFKASVAPQPEYAFTTLKYNSSQCRYVGYREPHLPYEVTKQYWEVIAARLAFVFVFQFVVYGITKFVAYVIPDRPKILDLKIRREEFLAKERASVIADENPVV